MTREDGFLPILILVIVVAVSAVGGATLYYTKKEPEQSPVKNQPQITNYAPNPHPSLEATEGTASQSPAPINVFTSSIPSVSPKVQVKTTELSPHLKDQVMQSASPIVSPVASSAPLLTSSCLKTNPVLVADITDFEKIQKITAPGTQSSEGPKGHSFVWTNGQKVPVYAPIAGVLESGAYSKDNESSPAQYLLMFKVKGYCDFQFKFDHIDEPVDVIRSALPTVPKVADSRGTFVTEIIEFNTGDLIGYTKGNIPSGNWDFGLYNMAEKRALKDSYGLHAYSVCWVDFYSSGKQPQYRSLLEGPKLVCSF